MSASRFPAWPVFSSDECEAALRVLRSGRVNYWTGGECREFEREWAASVGRQHALAMANGSVTLEAALRALGIGPGCDVLVSPRSFVASAMCVLNVGARPVFADVCPESGNVTAATLEAARTPATRAALPVHVGGWPCEMTAIMAWADTHGMAVIEDCAQSQGGTHAGAPLGSFGDAASWSFCQDKIVTTGGEGGMLVLRDPAAHKRAWSLAQHGKDFDLAGVGVAADAGASAAEDAGASATVPGSSAGARSQSFRWLVKHTGTNWRLTEMQAAIGRVQLRKLRGWLETRARNARILHEALAALPFLRVPHAPTGHAWYRFYAYTRPESGVLRDALVAAINGAGWPAFTGTCPEIYREPLFEERGLAPKSPLPVAAQLGATGMAFLLHPTIDEPTMRAYAAGAARAMEAACMAGAGAPGAGGTDGAGGTGGADGTGGARARGARA